MYMLEERQQPKMNNEIVLHWNEKNHCYFDDKMNPWFSGEKMPFVYPWCFNEYAKHFVEQNNNIAGETGHIEMDNIIDETLASLHPAFTEGIKLLRSMGYIWYS